MKIIGLNGSPRKKGNTAQLMDEVLQHAESKGAQIKRYDLNQLEMKGCQGCFSCKAPDKAGSCALKDDMSDILEEVLSADAVVLASPIYMWQVSAQAKIFTDRLMPLLKPDYSSVLNGQKMLPIYAQGQPDTTKFGQYFDYVNNMFTFLGFDTQKPVVAGGLRDVNDIHNQEEAKQNARAAAEELLKTN